jgi:glutamine synthetase
MSEDLRARIRDSGVDFLHLQFTDVPGALKSVTIPAGRLDDALTGGVWFDGSAVEGLARTTESDLYLRPDPATFAVVPWEPIRTGRLLCDLHLPDGTAFVADPRYALKAVLAATDELGFQYRVAPELEYFIFERRAEAAGGADAPTPVDAGGYFQMTGDRGARLSYQVVQALRDAGVAVETTHHEVASGQHEIDLAEMDALAAADAIALLKSALRAFGRREGLLVSFMPKPLRDASGSGLHMHQTLVDRASGANLFLDPDAEYQLSPIGRHFIAGQLAHARGMCAVLAPLVNSYRRLSGGAEAPARICWARVNRGALIRVPELSRHAQARIELRAPDPSCNPYLALAAMLRAGLDGIEGASPLPAPVEETLHPVQGLSRAEAAAQSLADPLPQTLLEALEELSWDPVVRDALGQPIFELFLNAKEQEWLDYARHVSRWELENYLEGA